MGAVDAICLWCKYPFAWWGNCLRLCPSCMAEHKRINAKEAHKWTLI